MKQRVAVHNLGRNLTLKRMSRNAITACIKANKSLFCQRGVPEQVSGGMEPAVGDKWRGKERGKEDILLGICG